MFGTKIRNWMEAQIARSRSKKKERLKHQQQQNGTTTTTTLQACPAFFGAANFDEFNESLHPSLPLSGSSFKPNLQPQQRTFLPSHRQPHHQQHHQDDTKAKVTQQQQQQQQGRGSVNLSSPESAYSTGYSTDGTSPCPATSYAPDCYINSRSSTQPHQRQQHQYQQQQRQQLTRVQESQQQRIDALGTRQQQQQLTSRSVDNSGTYSVTGRREYLLHQQQQQQQQPWRKPAPPTPIRTSSATSSPKIQPSQHHQLSMCRNSDSPVISNYPMQLFSPRRLPLVSNTTTQVMPMGSPRQCSRLAQQRSSPWQGNRGTPNTIVAPSAPYRAWGNLHLQHQPHQSQHQQHQLQQQVYVAGGREYNCCSRQESLSVGRSPVNRSGGEWRYTRRQSSRLSGQNNSSSRRSRRSISATSSCSSRSRSCSLSSSSSSTSSRTSRDSRSDNRSSSNSSAVVLPTSPSSDELTFNEVMGKFDENYLYEKDPHPKRHGCNSERDNSSNFSAKLSDASVSSLDLWQGGKKCGRSSRSSSRQRRGMSRGSSCRRPRQRRTSCRRSSQSSRAGGCENDDEDGDVEEEDEGRGRKTEAEVLQEILTRRLKRTANHSEAAAQMNRALLERLLMKNANGCTDYGFERRRAWSANTGGCSVIPAASRSVGGTPICLRRKPLRAGQLIAQSSRFARNRQVYPAESTSSLKDMSVSELALIKADKEADLKYAQLLVETERMLLSAREQLLRDEVNGGIRATSSLASTANNSPFRKPLANKRLELIRNAELTPFRSRNSQPELSSGSIRDLLEHSSPKRLLQMQQKKVIDPVVSHAVASTQTAIKDYSTYKSLRATPMVHQGNGLSRASEQYSCPQSEPLRRKVYDGQEPFRYPLPVAAPWLSNSDDDCTSDQRTQLQSTSAASSSTQLRKHMIIETLQGLKQSLQNQSAALKRGCLQPL